MDDLEIYHFKDERGFNLLMMAAEAGHIEAVNDLILRDFEVNHQVNGETAASLAFAFGHHEIVLTLLKANSLFPYNYNDDFASDDLKSFVEICVDMHDRVKIGNEEKSESLKDFLCKNHKKNLNLRHFYDTENNSLLKTSILSKMFGIYEFLLTCF